MPGAESGDSDGTVVAAARARVVRRTREHASVHAPASLRDPTPKGDAMPHDEVLRRGRLAQADLILTGSPGGRRLVRKDYSARPFWIRRTWSRWLCAREQAAYRTIERQLGQPEWLPRLTGRVGPEAFLMTYRPGRPLARALADTLPAGFVDELEAAVRALHAAGVVHLDLSHRSNVLVDASGHPVLLDFASSMCAPPGGVRHRLLVGLLGALDRRALRKWRRKLRPPDPAR